MMLRPYESKSDDFELVFWGQRWIPYLVTIFQGMGLRMHLEQLFLS